MKKYNFFTILTCMMSFFYFTACERTGLQTTNNDYGNFPISYREIEDCDECPNETDCCCGIELVNLTDAASFRICGTTDGNLSCSASSPPSPCISINNGGQVTPTLDDEDSKYGFCVAPGNSFYIENNTSGAVDLYVTCQDDVVNPQRIMVTVPGFSRVYVETNGSCVVGECD